MAMLTCAAAARMAPSNANGVVTTATVSEPISRATCEGVGVGGW